MQNKTIFDKLGGQANIDAAVVKFYQKVLSDPSVSHYFKNTDMKKQTENQQKFLTMAFGGPNNYTGRDMKAGHAGLGITTVAFNTIVKHLGDTLKEMGVPAEVIAEAAAVAETTRADIVEIK
ncbi:unnamed protein product (macronuclear) [Paramecium tetraurelia]|uniref:Group 1 truncated hemoglobin n=1 Tax=Paramecium tetraurelia TaxID=5888 RepID=A0BGI7_PARTE|nr:uncharacterized protein GSPATT00028689001 [Paramecium tetraurelia]CAK57654.1 unnamed protein product [Paramecium tetraurelia]|eukprot:XP_001425052.1 hypothetical protein (macronuclear) [Paramecium tetraurelia strain d4-2]